MGEPLYDHPVYLAVLGLLNSEWFVWFDGVLGFVVLIVFFAYCLSGEGRDERGRAIIGTSCMYGTVVLIILFNLLSMFCVTAMTNVAILSKCLRVVGNGYFVTVLICIAIFRNLR